ARIPLAALTNLRSERRPLEHLQLAANADGAKVVHDALAHIEVRRERHVLEVEAVGEAGMRQQLFGLLEVVLRHGHVLAFPPYGVAIFRAVPVAPWLPDPLRLLLDHEVPVDRVSSRLTHPLVAVRTALPVVAR